MNRDSYMVPVLLIVSGSGLLSALACEFFNFADTGSRVGGIACLVLFLYTLKFGALR